MPQLSFQPSVISVQNGVPFNLDIMLDAGPIAVDSTDVDIPLQGMVLNNLNVTTLLGNKFVASNPSKILFSQYISPGGTKFIGAGLLATATLTTTQNKVLSFNFTPGSTIDSNLVVDGVDILSTVGNAIINITTMPMPPALVTVIQNWLTSNAVGAKLTFATGSTYTPPPTAAVPQPIALTITG